MQIAVKKAASGAWFIQSRTTIGVATGRTPYPTKEAAIAEAERRHPGVKIHVEE